MKYLLITSALFVNFLGCNKKIESEKGGIDVISNIYLNASKGLDEVQTIHISNLNYNKGQILELIPVHDAPDFIEDIYLIENDVVYQAPSTIPGEIVFSDLRKENQKSVYQKTNGVVFLKDSVPYNYEHGRILKDTILFGKHYMRYEINSPESYSRYYLYKTDTILPYSLYNQLEKRFNGRLERIDSYDKKQDIFISMQLIPRKDWDETAKEIFEYNHYLENRN